MDFWCLYNARRVGIEASDEVIDFSRICATAYVGRRTTVGVRLLVAANLTHDFFFFADFALLKPLTRIASRTRALNAVASTCSPS